MVKRSSHIYFLFLFFYFLASPSQQKKTCSHQGPLLSNTNLTTHVGGLQDSESSAKATIHNQEKPVNNPFFQHVFAPFLSLQCLILSKKYLKRQKKNLLLFKNHVILNPILTKERTYLCLRFSDLPICIVVGKTSPAKSFSIIPSHVRWMFVRIFWWMTNKGEADRASFFSVSLVFPY